MHRFPPACPDLVVPRHRTDAIEGAGHEHIAQNLEPYVGDVQIDALHGPTFETPK